MHRTLLLVALFIGAAVELTGCGHCDCGLPYEWEHANDSVAPFLIDDTTPTRTFVADVIISGPWEVWDEEDARTPTLFVTANVEPPLGALDGPAGVHVRAHTEDETLLGEFTLPYEDSSDYSLRAESVFAACEPGTPCHAEVYVDVTREPDIGTSQITVGTIVRIASWATHPELVAAVTVEPY